MKRKLDIIYTSDTHGHVFPVDYPAGKQEDSGILNMAHQIRRNKNTLILDGGDTLQGTPLSQYYIAHSSEYPYHPMAEAFNALGCDYFTLGNHDFNFGYEALRDYLHAMRAECICANVEDLRGELGIRRDAVHILDNGLRVGITGIVTDYVNVWEQPQNLAGLAVTSAFEAARDACKRLQKSCDICICIYHGGFEEDLETGALLSESTENIACRIARELDFDLLLTGHQHMAVEGVWLNGTYAVQPPANAAQYIHLKIEETGIEGPEDAESEKTKELGFEEPENAGSEKTKKLGSEGSKDAGAEKMGVPGCGGEKLPGKRKPAVTSELVRVGAGHEEQPYKKLLSIERDTQKWLDEPVGLLREKIEPEEKLEAALYGSRLADLFNEVQLDASGADFSCTSLGNCPVGLEKKVTMRDICGAYLFANTLVVLEVDAAALRAALERCASYFVLKQGTPQISAEFLKPKVEHYNYDFYAGLDYEFDLTRPVGQRVVKMVRPDGSPLLPDRKYRLVTSNYRATGTGGYEALGRCRVLWRGAAEVPELIASYIRRNSPLKCGIRSQIAVKWQ
ncbi:MAG: bifunctional UDP-sugar hydrolase/5'-nucleotidase [Lachnospiraceae bacterium]|nr:bifunctional UDP-sugar hydrolase/5'-nucleotidase [Lachnospiraceae bacterium]